MLTLPYLSYTIPSFTVIDEYVKAYNLSIVQATANMRQFPTKRNIAGQLASQLSDCRIVVHYDFVYIVSRWALFRSSVKEAILTELRTLTDPRIIGVVMHTDNPVAQDIYELRDNQVSLTWEQCKDRYLSAIWDIKSVHNLINDFNVNIFDLSLRQFISDYQNNGPVILLENTTKTPKGLNALAPYLGDKIQCCFDTEHHFACGNEPVNVDYRLVHLNPIPEGVEKYSRIDRHSETTLDECSYFTPGHYQAFINYLTSRNIPYVRECYTDTMKREISQVCLSPLK